MKKKFAGVLVVAVCALLASAGQVLALSTSSPYHVSAIVPGESVSWETYAAQTTMYSVFSDYRSVNSTEYTWRKFNSNCFFFARLVTNKMKHVDFNYQCDGMRGIYLYGGHVKGVGDLSGRPVDEIARLLAQHLNNASGTPSVQTIENAFSEVQPGDVVQFRGWAGQYQHTMVVAEKSASGFETLEGNRPNNTVRNSYVSYSEFRNWIAAAGNAGGFSIYRFGSTTPPPPKPVINRGLLMLNSYSYAQAFTRNNTRYTEVYRDEELTTLRSSTSWTGENDDDRIIGVGWTSRNVPYAHIKYPSGNKWLEAYVKLRDVFVNGDLDDEPKTAQKKFVGLSARKNGNKNNNYWIDPGDSVWLLTSEDNQCQVLYPIQSGKYRIAWLSKADYNNTVNGEYPDPSITFRYKYFYSAKVGQSYSDYDQVNCQNDLDSVTVSSGSLPNGISISRSEKYVYLSGTPSAAGTYTFELKAKDVKGGYSKQSYTLTVEANVPPITAINYNYYSGKLGVSYNDYVYVVGGTEPFRVSLVNGSIPQGLRFYVSGRRIYLRGTPTRYGSFTFKIKVTDKNMQTYSRTLSLNIAYNTSYYRGGAGEDAGSSAPEILTSKLPNASAGTEYLANISVSGADPITWEIIDGELPSGMAFNDESGDIGGVPQQTGKFKFKVKATNSEGSDTKKYTLKVNPAKPVITTTVIPNAVLNGPYSFKVEAEGVDIKYSKKGKLPKGLKINKLTGEISGTPTKAGTYTFSIKAKNKGGMDIVEYTMTVAESTGTKASAAVVSAGVRDEANTPAVLELENTGLAFRIDNEDATLSNVRVFVNDELAGGVAVASDGTFTLPAEYADREASVYAAGLVDGAEFETTEVDVESEVESREGGCDAGMSGMMMLLAFGAILFRKK